MKRILLLLLVLALMVPLTISTEPPTAATTYQVSAATGSSTALALDSKSQTITICNDSANDGWVHFGSGNVNTTDDLYLTAGACTPNFTVGVTAMSFRGDGATATFQVVATHL